MSGAATSYGLLWRLLRVARPSVGQLGAAATMALVSAAGTLCFPLLARRVVDQLAAGKTDALSIGLLAAILVGAALASALSAYLLACVGHGLVARLRAMLVDKLLKLPVAAFDQDSTGERVSRVLSDCDAISELATKQAVNLLTGVLLLSGSVGVLLMLDVRLTLTLLGCVAGAFCVVIPLALLLEGLARSTQDRTAKLGGILTHVFSEIRLVKAFTAEGRERARSAEEIEELRRLGLKASKINAALEPVIGLALTAAIIVILVYGTGRVSSGAISIGTLTAFILYIFNVAAPLIQLTNFAAELQKARGASSRIGALLDEREEEQGAARAACDAQDGTLEFRGVSFAYPGQERRVLDGLDLAFRPGTTTALVGASGNGKTTILSLIERFYQPSEGELLYGGVPIGQLGLADWRGKIGYVAQGAPVMPGSVRANITYGLPGLYTDAMVLAAADKAGALAFIEQMPQGLDTLLIEQGNNLSGGQRQRIAIARMFLRNPAILILDEATSNLDSETEHQVKTALEALMQGRTNIVVAHRLATVVHADCIYFLEGGKVSGAGNHHELISSHPYYARLVARQFQNVSERPAMHG
ncbi:ABC transporter ATP-binding protein [Massilia atriviolacea]|uniref:ABC transporter ATP-binding protein n=1 Tax=Massilia atriviolacea TaxID=2495579 RepID=A0A430HS28_9BURK|nr:ABC transporter ATP-binding protein [Massilia atriviolacea]RSZ60358.1 ABC transporter ATP-binding protein [Massilia atriviolacea]